MKNKTVEVNKTYLDSIATLNQELDYHKDLVRTKEHADEEVTDETTDLRVGVTGLYAIHLKKE